MEGLVVGRVLTPAELAPGPTPPFWKLPREIAYVEPCARVAGGAWIGFYFLDKLPDGSYRRSKERFVAPRRAFEAWSDQEAAS